LQYLSLEFYLITYIFKISCSFVCNDNNNNNNKVCEIDAKVIDVKKDKTKIDKDNKEITNLIIIYYIIYCIKSSYFAIKFIKNILIRLVKKSTRIYKQSLKEIICKSAKTR